MKPFFLTFDVEEFDYLHHYHEKLLDSDLYGVSREGVKRILELLNRHHIRATFFVTANFALQYPSFIKEISQKHEIALHGYSHDHHYASMDESMAFSYLQEAKFILEKIIKKKVQGFRAPRMTFTSYSLLKKLGMTYDSSLHPTYIPGHYNNFTKPRNFFIKEGISVIPVSVTPLFRLPIAWLWFRNLPLAYTKICIMRSLQGIGFINTYFHPWEFVGLQHYQIPWYFKRNTGEKVLKKLDMLLHWCKRKNFVFMSISDYLKHHET